MSARYDVIVIGAGLAGLSAAVQAAQLGASVRVLESHELGGRAQSDERRGFTFNRGPHALFNEGEAKDLLKKLGVPFTGTTKSLRGAKALYRDELHVLPLSPTTILRTDLLESVHRLSFARIMTTLPKSALSDLAPTSASEWCEQVAPSEDIAILLQAFIRLNTYCRDLAKLSAEAAVTQLRRSLRGVSYIDGGWQSIVDGLAARARNEGAEITSRQPVTALEFSWGAVRVTTELETIEVRAVVLACGGPDAFRQLVPQLLIDEQGSPITATCLDLGLTSPPVEHFILGIDEPVYLSLHDPPARLAPSGEATLSVMAYGGQGRKDVQRLDQLAHIAGVSASDVIERRALSHMTVAHSMPRPGTSFQGRPRVAALGVERCFLAGDWVGDSGLLADAAVASGVIAGRLATQA